MPILVVGLVSQVAVGLIGHANKVFDLKTDSSIQVILIVVLFGIGTDYILFFLFRYRERLREGEEQARRGRARARAGRRGDRLGRWRGDRRVHGAGAVARSASSSRSGRRWRSPWRSRARRADPGAGRGVPARAARCSGRRRSGASSRRPPGSRRSASRWAAARAGTPLASGGVLGRAGDRSRSASTPTSTSATPAHLEDGRVGGGAARPCRRASPPAPPTRRRCCCTPPTGSRSTQDELDGVRRRRWARREGVAQVAAGPAVRGRHRPPRSASCSDERPDLRRGAGRGEGPDPRRRARGRTRGHRGARRRHHVGVRGLPEGDEPRLHGRLPGRRDRHHADPGAAAAQPGRAALPDGVGRPRLRRHARRGGRSSSSTSRATTA